jgi:hypothetical protein
MNIFWFIYLIGFITALFFETCEFRKWCIKNHLDPNLSNWDFTVMLGIFMSSIGSWVSVAFWYLSRDKD